MSGRRVLVSGAFDDIRSREVRFIHEASMLGELHVRLWSDQAVLKATGRAARFPAPERRYLLESLRFVSGVEVVEQALPRRAESVAAELVLAVTGADAALCAACAAADIRCELIDEPRLAGFPPVASVDGSPGAPARPKVVVTGCYDWLHSGHVRFFEEVSALGDLYVVLGNDANVRELKGEGHPRFPAAERRYMVEAIRYVAHALVATGMGWLDAEPEIGLVGPDIYAVNEDGDRPEKREFCEARGIRYAVLTRTPRQGLPRRSSTDLRGY